MASYREADRSEQARCVPFDALSNETQERLRRACRPGSEALLVADAPVSASSLGALGGVLLAAGLGAAVAILRHEFGSLEGRWSVPTTGVAAGVSLGLAFLGVVLLSRAFGRIEPVDEQGLPPGVYLLVHALVDARRDCIRIFPTNLLERIRTVHGRLRFTFADGAMVEMAEQRAAADLGRALEAAQRRCVVAAATGDVATVSRLDPFEAQRRWPADVAPPARGSTPWAGLTAAMMVAGLAAGTLAARRLGRMSDEAGVRQAMALGDDQALRDGVARGGQLAEWAERSRLELGLRAEGDGGLVRYLATDGRWREEALAEMLVRLERSPTEAALARYLGAGGPMSDRIDSLRLQMALAQRSSAALRAYLTQGGRRGDEVQRKLLPRQRLHDAVETGDVGELRELATPVGDDVDPTITAEADQTLRQLYEGARQRLQERVGYRSSPLVRMLDSVLAQAATSHHAPHVQFTLSYVEAGRSTSHYRDSNVARVPGPEVDSHGISAALTRGVASAIAQLVEPRWLRVGGPDAEPLVLMAGRPARPPVVVDVTPVHITYWASHYHWYFLEMDFELTLPDRSVLLFEPHCSVPRSGVSQLVAQTVAESLAGHRLDCPARGWPR